MKLLKYLMMTACAAVFSVSSVCAWSMESEGLKSNEELVKMEPEEILATTSIAHIKRAPMQVILYKHV